MKTQEAGRDGERDFGREVAIRIKRAMLAIDRIAEQTLKANLDLTLSQFWVLTSLKRHEGAPQTAVCRLLGLTPAAVSRQTEALRAKGLLLREDNPSNRREHVLTLTDEGRRQVAHGSAVLREKFDHLYQEMDAGQKDALEGSLDLLLDALRGHHLNR